MSLASAIKWQSKRQRLVSVFASFLALTALVNYAHQLARSIRRRTSFAAAAAVRLDADNGVRQMLLAFANESRCVEEFLRTYREKCERTMRPNLWSGEQKRFRTEHGVTAENYCPCVPDSLRTYSVDSCNYSVSDALLRRVTSTLY